MRRLIVVMSVLAIVVAALVIPALAQTVSTTACPGAPAPRLKAGSTGRVAQVYSSLRAGLDSNVVLTVMYRANNDTFTVVNGPYCASGPYNWYQVQFKGINGWVTEGTGSTYWIEPVTPVTPTPTKPPVTPTVTPLPTTPQPTVCAGAPAPRLKIGGTARPAQVFSSLRAAFDSNVVLTVMYKAKGDTFKVLAGPYCGSRPHNWWQVDYKGKVGWVTEGYGSTYWVEPVQ